MVLALLPVPYRIRTASRVCKQWRSVTLGSITDHTLYAPADASAALRLLPSLRHLTLVIHTQLPISLHLPSSLTSLKLCGSFLSSAGAGLSIASPCPSLTKLHVTYVANADAITTLISASANTLCSLSLATDLTITALTSLRLPSLTSLHFNAPETFLIFKHLMENHAAQLTHLRLTGEISGRVEDLLIGLVAKLAFPALTTLQLHEFVVHTEQLLREFIARAPRLGSLTLGDLNELGSEQVQELAAPLLTSFWTRWRWLQDDTPTSLLGRFPRLSAVRGVLHLRQSGPLHLISERLGHTIRRLCITQPTPEVLHPVLEHCTLLRSLDLKDASETCLASCQPFPAARLPHLTELVFSGHACSPRTAVGFVSEMSSCSPNLRFISVASSGLACGDVLRACPSLLVLRFSVPMQHLAAMRQFADHPTVRVIVREVDP